MTTTEDFEASGNAEFEALITQDGVDFDARDEALLRAIDRQGSLNHAAEALDRSFAHAQRRIVALEEAFGQLVERRRGGADGGGSELTDQARTLLARFDRLRSEFSGVAAGPQTLLTGQVVETDGELVTVQTPIGRLTARYGGTTDRVAVSIRADAITLTAPTDAPEEDGTSARNRFDGEVVAVDTGETLATVEVAIGGDRHLTALVTMASVDRLGLDPGVNVVAAFKATATRAIPLD